MNYFFQAASAEHQKREKAKARELRQSQWWRQEVGKGVCYHCQERFKPEDLTMDHLIPIARGGKSTKKNCVPSCKTCNTKKGHHLTVELVFAELDQAAQSKFNEVQPSETNQVDTFDKLNEDVQSGNETDKSKDDDEKS